MNHIHFCVFRNVQKEKKRCHGVFLRIFPVFPCIMEFFSRKNRIILSYHILMSLLKKACRTHAGEAS
ncbi:MAG: hypothetical protein B6245_21335 [Desulfobacteraceae bacterium 4572_88]|nr:MAG: hypothetical protein B6245_21335 [Desulfobacteraceae bacterium 4572_88]